MKVVKFGGSSLATGPQLEKAINIVTADADRRIMVVSAPGKRQSGDTKVTDLLSTLADAVVDGTDTEPVTEEILSRYVDIARYFGVPTDIIDRLRRHLGEMAMRNYPSNDYLYAAFMAQGEFMNAQLVAEVMTHQHINARFVGPRDLGITVAGEPRSATVTDDSYARIAQFELRPDEIIVVPGFFAYDKDGNIATFARGGSDITGSILARGFNVDLYENFTDVSSVYAVDPHVVEHPRAIRTLTYREMRELAYSGFSVFNDEAIIPVIQAGIRVNVKNTNDPEARGTFIAPTKDVNHHHHITGVAANRNFVGLYLHRYLINTQVGFTLRLLQILRKYNVSYEHMPSGIDDLTIIIDKGQLSPDKKRGITADIKSEIAPDQLEWFDDFAVLMIVGEGLYAQNDLLAKIMVSLADVGIAPTMINQGASRISIMLGVPAEQADDAVRAVYELSCTHRDPVDKEPAHQISLN